jgi:hypothetical protein
MLRQQLEKGRDQPDHKNDRDHISHKMQGHCWKKIIGRRIDPFVDANK